MSHHLHSQGGDLLVKGYHNSLHHTSQVIILRLSDDFQKFYFQKSI